MARRLSPDPACLCVTAPAQLALCGCLMFKGPCSKTKKQLGVPRNPEPDGRPHPVPGSAGSRSSTQPLTGGGRSPAPTWGRLRAQGTKAVGATGLPQPHEKRAVVAPISQVDTLRWGPLAGGGRTWDVDQAV